VIARLALLLLPFALVGLVAPRRALRLGQLPNSLYSAGLVSAADLPAVRWATRRLTSARSLGALGGLVACAVLVLALFGSLSINVIALLAGVALGATLGQWWVGRMPRHSRRTAPLGRRRLVDLVGRTPLVLLSLMSASAVVLDVFWVALRPSGSRTHHLPTGGICVSPAVSSVSHHLLSWAFIAPVLLISVGGGLLILRRAVDPTVPASADAALRAAAIRTVLGGGMLVAGGHALTTAVETESFAHGCTPSSAWWAIFVGLAIAGTLVMLCWCVAAYVLAPARRPAPLLIPQAPDVAAVS
jgi:hypothetical protein